MSQYKVSVIMASYNGEKYISDAIHLFQTKHSKIGSWLFVMIVQRITHIRFKRVREKYPDKFQVLHNEKNLRLAASLNRAIEYTRGEYIARMDDDDVSLRAFCKRSCVLDAHPDVSFVSANIKLFDEDGIGVSESGLNSMLAISIVITYCSSNREMIRKKDLVEGGYTVSPILTSRTEDYDLWCKLMYANKKAHNR